MIIAKKQDKTVFYDSYIHCKPLEFEGFNCKVAKFDHFKGTSQSISAKYKTAIELQKSLSLGRGRNPKY